MNLRQRNEEIERLNKEMRCMWCARFFYECRCSWWTKYRVDVGMLLFCGGLLLLLWCMR